MFPPKFIESPDFQPFYPHWSYSGVGKCPNSTSRYWGYFISNRYLKGIERWCVSQIPNKKGHWTPNAKIGAVFQTFHGLLHCEALGIDLDGTNGGTFRDPPWPSPESPISGPFKQGRGKPHLIGTAIAFFQQLQEWTLGRCWEMWGYVGRCGDMLGFSQTYTIVFLQGLPPVAQLGPKRAPADAPSASSVLGRKNTGPQQKVTPPNNRGWEPSKIGKVIYKPINYDILDMKWGNPRVKPLVGSNWCSWKSWYPGEHPKFARCLDFSHCWEQWIVSGIIWPRGNDTLSGS